VDASDIERLLRHHSLAAATSHFHDKLTMTTRKEEVYVLYGSQTGNSEQAAKDLCGQVETRLGPEVIQKLTDTKDSITVVPTHMQLDDFLEIDRAKWTRLIVVIVSSYGVGSAPLGAYRFRELCDAWLNLYGDKNDNPKILNGCHFAMCGLGDSKFPTFFENPTKINESLMLVGAKRVGPLGKADASGTGKEVQANVIDRWMDGIWPELATVVAMKPLPEEQLEEMQNRTVALMKRINPDFMPEKSSNTAFIITIISFLIGIIAVLAGYQSIMVNKK
jgi:sulfite reductase alpha subunit-like flavoprotein